MSAAVGATRSALASAASDLLAWFAFLIAAVALAVRFVPVVNHGVLILAALSPYLAIGAGVTAALLTLRSRRWWAAAGCLALLTAAVGVQVPRLIPANVAEGVAVRVLTANLRESQADAASVVALARSHADLLLLQELKPELARELSVLSADFPYRALHTNDSPGGVAIWSRYRLANPVQVSGHQLGMLSATITIPGVAIDPRVLVAHVVGPWPQPIDDWRSEIARLRTTLADMARTAGDGAVIAAGDFNATVDMLPFRLLLDTGYRDAAEQAGAGVNPTFPADSAVPPLIGIDHILTRNSSASDVRTVRIPGSDHLAVTATIQLPR